MTEKSDKSDGEELNKRKKSVDPILKRKRSESNDRKHSAERKQKTSCSLNLFVADVRCKICWRLQDTPKFHMNSYRPILHRIKINGIQLINGINQ